MVCNRDTCQRKWRKIKLIKWTNVLSARHYGLDTHILKLDNSGFHKWKQKSILRISGLIEAMIRLEKEELWTATSI